MSHPPTELPPVEDAAVARERTDTNLTDIRGFCRWLRADNAATLTVTHRSGLLRRLSLWLSTHHRVSLRDATEDHLTEWRYTLTCSPRTAAGYISALHVFYGRYLMDHLECREDDPSRRIRRPRRVKKGVPHPVEEQQVRLVLEGAEHNIELFAWLMLMRYGGLRSMEVAGLRVSDLADRDGGGLWLLVAGKGGVARKVPVAPEVTTALAPFRRGQGYLFTRPTGAKWSARDISQRVNDHFRALAVGHTAHHLRHSFATRTLEVEPNIRKLQVLMGHASADTTAMYLLVEPEGAADVVDLMTARSIRRHKRRRL